MDLREQLERSIRGASGEALLLMSIVADDTARMAIEAELERRARPHLDGRLARRPAMAGVEEAA